VIAEAALERYCLGEIAQRRRGSVSVDIVDVLAIEPRVAQRVLHAARRALATLLRRSHVVGVALIP